VNISQPFISRPIATTLLMIGIVAFGLTGYVLLPVAALPTVDFPTIQVSAQLPGASPETMASSVATPLEQQFAAIPGLSQMTSTSGLGSTSIALQFVLSRDLDGASQDVQTAINAAGGLLPKNLPNPPTYRKDNPTERALLIYAVHSDTLPMNKVDDYAYTILAQKMSAVSGVSQVSIMGQQKFAVRVQVDPNALAARGVGLEDVRNALANTSTDQPKGNLENDHQAFTLDTNDQIPDARGFNQVIVAYRNGAPVRIQDIGGAIDSVEQIRQAAWFGGKRAELLMVRRAAGANTVEVVNQEKALVDELRKSLPPGVKVDLMSDRSDTIRASVSDVRFTLILTIFLVVMVIFLFLRKMWATIIPGIAVPISIIGTFGAMYVLGYSVDNLSLMGLSIAVGFVVDDAIVMIENIVRYIEAGDTPLQAAMKGSGQIGFTIISISVSLVAVFIPLLFMSGLVGKLFREFAMTVTVAVMVSTVVSLTLTPMMCAQFLDGPGIRPRPEMGASASVPDTRFNRSAARADDIPIYRNPQGILPAAGHGLHLWGGRQPPGHFVCGHFGADPRSHRKGDQGSGGLRRHVVRRSGRQRYRERGADVHPAQTPQSARCVGRPDHPAAAARDGAGDGHQVFHAGGTGHQRRRPPDPHPVPIHAHRYRFR
jgi:multidrug efflux pump subunit AcrB